MNAIPEEMKILSKSEPKASYYTPFPEGLRCCAKKGYAAAPNITNVI